MKNAQTFHGSSAVVPAGHGDVDNEPAAQAPDLPRLLPMAKVLEIVPFSRQHLLRLEKRGRFPRRILLGDNRVAWLEPEIRAWINARAQERDRPA